MPTRKTPIPASARCLICGEGLALPVFDCPTCATPHHAACWQWTGGCAVYGCKRRPRPVPEVAPEAPTSARPLQMRVPPGAIARPLVTRASSTRGAHDGASLLAAGLWLLLGIVCCALAQPDRVTASPRSSLPMVWADGAVQRTPEPAGSATKPMKRPMTPVELAERAVRDDSLWIGSGTQPAANLRSMMVAREGSALRSGVRQLAVRDLPGWVRARVRSLLELERTGPWQQALAPRRP